MEDLEIKPVLLIIDDDRLICSTLSEYFEECGYTVIQAGDGRDERTAQLPAAKTVQYNPGVLLQQALVSG